MTISERIFNLMEKKHMSQAEFARKIGMSTSGVSDWKKKKANPMSDKIMDICEVLEVTPEYLLTGKDKSARAKNRTYTTSEMKIIEEYHDMKDEQKARLRAYIKALKKLEELEAM